ncbi:MAG: tRNA pseudouridine(38-40) synthase TruA [bacterium]|jgi:tRNA pseudouridine38-40 synthase|nr:tRNA pseudouridine(38-40) synthase TruA [candidate division KSB1 bacterium]MDH7561043.1 tRNA pseudouridine(38-40) synthase TruA [bacterium]
MTRNLKLVLEYDGTDFCGWQRQPGVRTVQGELERVLEQLLQHPVNVTAAGRTDVGVHAQGQVVNFFTERHMQTTRLLRGLNALLPPDVRALEVEEVPAGFHARCSALARVYRYRIATRPRAIGRQHVWHYPRPLDLQLMRRALQPLLGEHDFRSFCRAEAELPHYRCCIEEASWSECQDELWLDIRANRFLHGMVRTIVGTLVEVGRGKISAESVEKMLQARNRRAAGPTAPAQGLCLLRVVYPADLTEEVLGEALNGTEES